MTEQSDDQMTRLFARLRRSPSLHSVPGSLPVLFFGDLPNARAATVGINPSDREYLDSSGAELEGAARRFETLKSLGARTRRELDDKQCARAIETMRAYYRPGKPVYTWFRPMARVVEGFGLSYERGEVAHLDLVQEATSPTWSDLGKQFPAEAESMLRLDRPFLKWELETYDLSVVLCNGRTVFEAVLGLLAGQTIEAGKLAETTWWTARAHAWPRPVALVGWNMPLQRPTGLGASGESELGRLLAERARAIAW